LRHCERRSISAPVLKLLLWVGLRDHIAILR
jgi:hypothetical protein